uniref:Transposase-associated domain-containing protein n=1 Tax=Tanacetum cinerariifolium TaxID=118510 RepID=A0A6L2KD95_TANCI|nr:hypothetical protein [Tanacetum cinerariifolium]
MEGLYSRSMLVDRSWMEQRLESHGCSVTQQFKKGVEHFMDFAYSNAQFVTGATIKCPCHKCTLLKFQDRETATVHLYLWGFLSSYTAWSEHGKSSTSDVNEPDVPRDNVQRENRYREMEIDAAGPDLREFFAKEAPNSNAAKFFELVRCADEPLWDGCQNHNRLSAVSLLMNVKSDCNMSESCYNRVIYAVKSMLQTDASFPDDFYQSKKMLKKLVLSYVKIHACPCMLFWKEHAEKKKCIVCGHLRFKKGKEGRGKARTETAKYMSWHKYDRRPEGVLTHPCDGVAWKHIDRVSPSFAAEERNVRLGLSTDGFNPFGHISVPYSCWPVFVTPYNLPPLMCMKEVLFLTLIIPGPQSPGKNIDVYLRPLIDELKMLWDDGVTFDVSREQNFKMRAILLWTISDFPAYGMLSGWSTHGKMSCPYCMENTKAFTLKNGGKPNCHRQFLPLNHPFRNDKDKFFVRRVEKSGHPPPQKWPGYGKDHNWTKKSIFWELPYWSTNLICHNLDVMRIEKNVFENVFNTVMDVKGKTKDNIKSREDLKRYCKRPNLNMFTQGSKLMKPKAQFALSKSEIRTICEWIKQLKFPDGYSSNISKCVNLDDCKLYGLKSHDCHVFMERLIPIAFREMLPKGICDALTEPSHYFRDIVLQSCMFNIYTHWRKTKWKYYAN